MGVAWNNLLRGEAPDGRKIGGTLGRAGLSRRLREGSGMASGHGEYKVPGGKLVVADVVVNDGRLAQVRISGDFFLEPPEALAEINNALTDQHADATETELALVVALALPTGTQMFGFSPEAIAVAVRRALE
jgi:hypothetical protein